MAKTSSTAAVIAAACIALSACGGGDSAASLSNDVVRTATAPRIVPPDIAYQGKTYAEWAGAFWKWALELPLDGHPFTTCKRDLSAGQSGKVWYWAAPIDKCPGHIQATLPPDTALFLTMLDAETSSLEDFPFHGDTKADQRSNSIWLANHIHDIFCTIDGVPVTNLQAFRFVNPQIRFTAPTPWVFGATGGTGTSVGDGYFLMLEPLSKGKHTIHYGGAFHFDAGEIGPDAVDLVQDITIDLTVGKG